MATPETTARHLTAPAPPTARSRPAARALASIPLEVIGYVLLALGLGGFLWSQIRNVDAFYLDEWVYVHGAEYMWRERPLGVIETIPEWTRGPQRLYTMLLAGVWGPLSPSAAYTASHLLNVALLVSAVAPAALLARRIIRAPALRVFAVALGVAVPWLAIGSHLLTENLAFPLYLWLAYATVCAAEKPSPRTQIAALAVVFAAALTRINLASLFLMLVLTVVVAELRDRREHRGDPFAAWLRAALRREALLVVATAGCAILIVLLASARSDWLSYGGVSFGGLDGHTIIDRLFGAQAGATRRTMLTYTRGLIVGSFVMPFVLGFAVALAGATGRLGRRMLIPSVVALAGFVAVIVPVSVSSVGAALEERYVFYAYTPIALLAVAGIEHANHLRRWVVAAGAFSLWCLMVGYPAAGTNAGHFFAAPAGAFWTRVVEHRLRRWEDDVFGWMFIAPTGWLLIAVAIAVLVASIAVIAPRPRVLAGVLTAGLAVCLAAQIAGLGYDFKQELYGTSEAPGGIALSSGHTADRETWLDGALPDGARGTVMPGPPGATLDGAERLQFWNKGLDAVVSIAWNGAPTPTPPGFVVVGTEVRSDGLARWLAATPRWLATARDDPRVQFAGRVVANSPSSRYSLIELDESRKAMWTAAGMDGDGAVLERRPATLTLDRSAARDVRRVALTVTRPGGPTRPARWRVTRDGRTVSTGRVASARVANITLKVPPCAARADCAPVRFRLRATGPAIPLPFPSFGAPGPPRPVVLQVLAARMDR